jgi:hypothetical protein
MRLESIGDEALAAIEVSAYLRTSDTIDDEFPARVLEIRYVVDGLPQQHVLDLGEVLDDLVAGG